MFAAPGRRTVSRPHERKHATGRSPPIAKSRPKDLPTAVILSWRLADVALSAAGPQPVARLIGSAGKTYDSIARIASGLDAMLSNFKKDP